MARVVFNVMLTADTITDERIRELRADEMYCGLARYIAAGCMRERSKMDPVVARVATGHTSSIKQRTEIAIKNRGWITYDASGLRVVTRDGLSAWTARIADLLNARAAKEAK